MLRLQPAVLAVLFLAAAVLGGHEGHDTPLRPVYKHVQSGTTAYRVGFAVIPQDPLVGEDVRFEFRILHAGSPEGPVTAEQPLANPGNPRVEIVPTQGSPVPASRVVPGDKPGTYVVRHRFAESGQYGISTRVQAAPDTVTAEFPVLVGAGPVGRAPIVVDVLGVLVIGAIAFSFWRTRRAAEPSSSLTLRHVATIAVGVALLVVAHVWIAPGAGRLFLPERHTGIVVWETAPPVDSAPAVEPHSHPEGTPPHTHPERPATGRGATPQGASFSPGSSDPSAAADAAEIASTVVAVPGQVVDVFVPITARVLFEDFVPRLGRPVRRGQTIAMLEHHYILHDANHLINERWPFLLRLLASRRATLEAELNASRQKQLLTTGDAAVRQMMTVTKAVPRAEGELVEARLAQQHAEKALAMHDAQISRGNLVRRPLTSPLDGTIDEVHFTQGQLKYENDKLLTIVDLSRVWIEARFPERVASRQPPARMTFVSSAFPEVRFDGRLARVANTLDADTRTVSAFFEVPNPQRLLRLGMRLTGRRDGEAGGADSAVSSGEGVRLAVDAVGAPVFSVPATVQAQPERTAEVTAPLWGRIEFAGRRLNVGDRVRKGENLVQVVLELAIDERYPMEARAVEINAERELARSRLELADRQFQEAVALLKASPDDPFRKQEVELTERRLTGAQLEETLLTRQAEAFQGVMKRRDPRITVVQAPISGVITEIGFRPGELNRTGEFRRLVTIVDPSRVWLEARVFAHQSAAVVHGHGRASFISSGLQSPRALDRPIAVSGSVDPESGTLRVIYDVANPGGALKVGASAQITVPRN